MDRDVTILGAGIVGICTGLSAVERGLSVRLIDRAEPGQATSFGNAGVISPWSIVPQSLPGTWRQIPGLVFSRNGPLSVRAAAWPRLIPWGVRFVRNGSIEKVEQTADLMEVLCGPSIELYRRHLTGTDAEDLVRDSFYVHAFRDGRRASVDALDYRIRTARGAEIERVGQDELRRLEPALSHDFEAAIVIRGQARAMSPGRIGQVLADKLRRLGADIQRNEIQAIRREDGAWTIDCGTEVYRSSKIVLAMGAWSDRLLKPLGLRLPLMAERGYHVEFPDPGITLNHSIMDVDHKVVASSMNSGLRIAGMAEFAPVDAPPDARKQAALDHLGRKLFPGLSPSVPKFWMGRRPSFPDSLPAIGEIPGHEGLICNFGHSHYGLMMAPKSGEIAADMLTGTATNADISAISPCRFA